jgi:hypothetical protein
VTYTLLNRSDLSQAEGTGTAEFEGYLHGSGDFSFLWVDMDPGEGVRLHKHPYEEVFSSSKDARFPPLAPKPSKGRRDKSSSSRLRRRTSSPIAARDACAK